MKATAPQAKKPKDLATIEKFIDVYCRRKHHRQNGQLCDDCSDLLAYATERLTKCPLDPKPKCKDCPRHCYAETYRRKIKDVMRFSGIYFVKRGRLDWLIRYFT